MQSFALKVILAAAAVVMDIVVISYFGVRTGGDELRLQTECGVTLCPSPSFGFPTCALVND